MDEIVYMVRGTTEAICRQALDRLCEQLGARPTMLPTDGTGRGWVARAVPMRKAPAETSGGPAVSG